jgi:hypothetical protein
MLTVIKVDRDTISRRIQNVRASWSHETRVRRTLEGRRRSDKFACHIAPVTPATTQRNVARISC